LELTWTTLRGNVSEAWRRSIRIGRHTLPAGFRVVSKPVLGELHHEYRLEKEAA
jgi:hypothetical protein